jgi:hypothetical protein
VGTLEGVGRIHQQTFIDPCGRGPSAKLYDRKTPLTAADLLNDRGLPFDEEHGLPLCRVRTDRGTAFCGAPDRHEHGRYLAVEDIAHTRTKARRPQTDGTCQRFPKTVPNKFYRVACRKTLDTTFAGLQTGLDTWLRGDNATRPHPGRWGYGRTPMRTFLDGVPLAKEKLLPVARGGRRAVHVDRASGHSPDGQIRLR